MVDTRLHHRYAAQLRTRETSRDRRRPLGVRTRPPADGRRCHHYLGTSAARRAGRPLVATRTRGQRPCGLVVRPCGAGATRLGLLARLERTSARCAAAATAITFCERGSTSPTTTAATPATPQILTGAQRRVRSAAPSRLRAGHPAWLLPPPALPARYASGATEPRAENGYSTDVFSGAWRRAPETAVGFVAKPRLGTKYRLPSES